jgi:hypothetical protein
MFKLDPTTRTQPNRAEKKLTSGVRRERPTKFAARQGQAAQIAVQAPD